MKQSDFDTQLCLPLTLGTSGVIACHLTSFSLHHLSLQLLRYTAAANGKFTKHD